MTAMKTTVGMALGALLACTLSMAQATPPPAPEAAKKAEMERQMQEAEKKAQAAEKRAQEAAKAAECKAQAAAEKARQIEKKIMVLEKRPRLGVLVNTDADAKSDPVGALLSGVTPGGAAEEAGVQAGDIIVKFNGQPLAGPNPAADEGESAPGLKLLELAKDLRADEKVTLEVRRGKETKSFTFVPRALGSMTWVFRDGEVPGLEGLKGLKDLEELKELKELRNIQIEIPNIPELLMLHGGGFDMELVALNPELGEYFGTSEGLLVVRAPKGDALKLRGGDVLLKIGDRAPKTPSQAMRILHSYEPGDAVSLEVMRKQKRQKITVKVPEPEESLRWIDEEDETPMPQRRSFRFFSGDEGAPLPPPAPSAPSAPATPEAPTRRA